MPNSGIRTEFDLRTRGLQTVKCEIGIKIDGRELPNLAVMGNALEKAVEVLQQVVTESYTVVPERVTT